MCLLEVVVSNAASKVDYPPHSGQMVSTSVDENRAPIETHGEPSTMEQVPIQENSQNKDVVVPASGPQQSINVHDILTQLPDSELHNLCNILALEGLVFHPANYARKSIAFNYVRYALISLV